MNRPHYSDGKQWDNRVELHTVRRVAFELQDRNFRRDNPALQYSWTGPTDPHQARICDAAMVQLGEILAAHRDWYTVMRISAAANRLRKAGE